MNAVAPAETTSRQFSRSLGQALNRPAVLPVPALALKAIFGEAAIVLLGSQRVEPRALTTKEFTWDFPTIRTALDDIVHERTAAIVNRETARDDTKARSTPHEGRRQRASR